MGSGISMKKALKFLSATILLWSCLLGISSFAFADAALDFQVTSVGYDNGVMKAIGKFINTGDKNIEDVTKVDVKIFLYNAAGESKQVADHYFTDLNLHLKPSEEKEFTLTFPDVPEYTDATNWSAEEGEWQYTYFDAEPAAPAAPAVEAPVTATIAPETAPASLDFVVTKLGYEGGVLTAIGNFKNTGGKNIEAVQKVDVKIFLFNEAGDSKMVADQYFTDLALHLKPTEEKEYTLSFSDIPEYTDATKWSAEEGEWEYTYFE
jgi:hypothetical protein